MDNTGAEQPVAMVSWKSSYGDEIDGRVTCTRQHQETTSDAANGRATLKGQFDKGEHQYVSYVHFPSILVTPESSPEQSRLPHMIKNTDILRQLEFPIGLVATFENRFSESSNNNNNSHFDFDFPPLTNSSYDAEKNATIEPLSLGLALSHPRDDCCSVDFDWALQPIDECVFMDEEDEVSLDSVKFSFLDHYDTSDHA